MTVSAKYSYSYSYPYDKTGNLVLMNNHIKYDKLRTYDEIVLYIQFALTTVHGTQY